MSLFVIGLAWAMGLSFTSLAGPVPSDPSTHKPSEQACAAARANGRALPGCDQQVEAELDEARPSPDQQGGRERFMVCPQDPRCPR